MASWFNRKRKVNIKKIQKVPLKSIDYSPKIILAWAKAIEGNEEITRWLKENGYEELAMATFAIYLKDDARNWLQQNGYFQLMAMINAAEGNEGAQRWLLKNDFEILYHIALAVEDEQSSWAWLKHQTTQDIFILAQTIKIIKDKIEEHHNDVHTFRQDL